MTMPILKEIRDTLREMIDGDSRGHDERITRLIQLTESASDELAEAYAAVACAASIRAEHRTNPGLWEHAYAALIHRAKNDHSKVIA